MGGRAHAALHSPCFDADHSMLLCQLWSRLLVAGGTKAWGPIWSNSSHSPKDGPAFQMLHDAGVCIKSKPTKPSAQTNVPAKEERWERVEVHCLVWNQVRPWEDRVKMVANLIY